MFVALTASVGAADRPPVEHLQGEVHRAQFRVDAGRQVVATGDLCIISAAEAVIDGLVVAEPGATVRIVAPSIIVRGTMRGGDGANRHDVLQSGQNGGSVILNAPYIWLDGATIRAGSGGNAGPAGNGGHGGDVVIHAFVVRSNDAVTEGGRAGEAGHGVHGFGDAAIHGGSGGSGGGVVVFRLPRPGGKPPHWADPHERNIQQVVDRVRQRFQKVFDAVHDNEESARLALEIIEQEGLDLEALSGVQLGQLLGHVYLMDVAGLYDPVVVHLSRFLDDDGADGATAAVHLYEQRMRQVESIEEKAAIYRDTFNHPGLEAALAAGGIEHLFFSVGVRNEELLHEVLPVLLGLKRLLMPEFAEHIRFQHHAYFNALQLAAAAGHEFDLQWYRQRMYELAKPELEKVENEGHRRMLADIIAKLGGAAARGDLIDHPAPPTKFLWSSVPEWSSLDDLMGNVIILKFWATWCGPCRGAIPHTRDLQRHYANARVVVLGVTVLWGSVITADGRRIDMGDDPEREFELTVQFAQDMDIAWPVVFVEKSVAGDYDAGLPGIVLIDADGIVRHAGLHPAQPKEHLTAKIDSLLRNADLTVPGEARGE